MATKYERFLRYHDIDIQAIEQATIDHANLAGLEDVSVVGATTGQVLTKLISGTYGFTTPAGADSYTEAEVDDLLDLKADLTLLGANSGIATLDSGGRLPSAQLTVHNHDSLYFTESEVTTLLAGKSNTGHSHAISDITSLTTALADKLDDSQLGAASGVASLDGSGKVPFGQIPVGSTSSTVTVGNDSRLSDSRTPTSHASSHFTGGGDALTPANISAVATSAVGAASGVASLDAGTKVPIAQVPTGTTGSTVSLGNHTHAIYQLSSEKAAASGYASLDSGVKVPIAQLPTGTSSTTVAIGNDSRLSDARTPTAHASSHVYSGSDPLTLTVAVASTGARPATGLYNGFRIYRTDKGWVEIYDGSAWRVRGTVTTAALADITDPTTGQLAFLTTDLQIYRYTGSAWITVNPFFHGYQLTGATQSISANTPVAITMTGEIVDNINCHSTSSNTSRYTPSIPGTYRCIGMLAVDNALTTGSAITAQFRKNGTNSFGSPYNTEFSISQGFAANTAMVAGTFSLNGSTDYIELWGNCGIATTTFANGTDMGSYMIIERIGP
jgi:hypothetical protein